MPLNDPFEPPFGLNVAETEWPTFPNLYFDRTALNRAVLDRRVSIVIGKRGAGKTALAKYLTFQSTKQYHLCVRLDAAGAFTSILDQLSKHISDRRPFVVEDAAKLWELIFWACLMRRLAADPSLPPLLSRTLARYLSTLNVRAGEEPALERSVLDALDQAALRRTSGIVELILAVRRIFSSAEFTHAQKAVSEYLDQGRRAVIVIDALDDYPIRDEAMRRALAALLRAVHNFSLGQQHPHLEIKCFLPAELVQLLRVTAVISPARTLEFPVYIRWSPDDLLRLICWRYAYFLNECYPGHTTGLGEINWSSPLEVKERIWRLAFHTSLRTRTGAEEDAAEYILRHTQLRPRQLIWLCNSIARHAAGSHQSSRRAFNQEHILAGVYDVEDSLADEVFTAYSAVYPNARLIFECLNGQPNIIDRASDLLNLAPRSNSMWPSSVDYSKELFLEMACELGLVGRVVGEDQKRYRALFSYATHNRFTLELGDRCAIHPMFYKTFRIRPVRDRIVCPEYEDLAGSMDTP